MKRLCLFVIFMGIIFLAACNLAAPTAVPAEPTLPLPATPTLAPTTLNATAVVTDSSATPDAAATPLSEPVSGEMGFQNLRFSAAPSAAPQGIFPAGSEEVFAVWEYSGMHDGDRVHRLWRFNGQDWLNKEEVWDTTVRGESGTVTDISIYDKEGGGLTPGDYELQLAVNGEWQIGGSFTILSRSAEEQPWFASLYFATDPGALAQTAFPVGTEEVFAVWHYGNMEIGDVVRRAWTFNGQPWLDRVETWDFDGYGSEGVMQDVSIYDFDGAGLQSGQYMLTIYINDGQQMQASFTIGDETAENVTLQQSSETRLAKVLDHTLLVVDEWDGTRHELAHGLNIVDLQWFWDGVHLLFVDRDESQRIEQSTIGVKHALYLANVDTGEVTQLGSFDEDFHDPQPAQSLRHIALISGTNYGDACGVDRRLVFMELNENWQRTAVYGIGDFEGAPVSNQYFIYPSYMRKMNWLDPHTFQAGIDVTCLDIDTAPPEDILLRGVYEFDMNTLTAVRVGDLP